MFKYIFPWFYVRSLEHEINSLRYHYQTVVNEKNEEINMLEKRCGYYADLVSKLPKRGKNGKFTSTK